MNFLEIKAKHEKMPYKGYGCLSYRIDQVIGSAEVNANDTVFTEKAATEDEWDRIAIGSLELLLSYSKDKQVCAWFKRIGFKW